MPNSAIKAFRVDAVRYHQYMREYLPLSFRDKEKVFDYTNINDRNNWVSIYDSTTWYGVQISGRFNLKAPKDPTPVQLDDESDESADQLNVESNSTALVKEIKSSLLSLKKKPKQWYNSKMDMLQTINQYNNCSPKQIRESEELQHYLCLMAHEKFVMQHCIEPRLKEVLGDAFVFFDDDKKAAYTSFDCLKRYRSVKREINQLSNVNHEEKKFLQSCLLHLMDHYYEHPTKMGPMDIMNYVAYQYIPVLGLVFTIAALTMNLITPGTPVALILTYLGYIGFTSSLASLSTYLTNAYHGVWRPSRSIVLDFVLTIVSVVLGCIPMMIHAAGYRWYYTELTAKYGSVFFDAITGAVNFFKSIFLIRDKDEFYYYPKALKFIRAIKHFTKNKVSSWIIYVKLGNSIFKDYSHWYKRLLHPKRTRHQEAKRLDACLNPSENPQQRDAAYQINLIKYQAALSIIPSLLALCLGVLLLSNPITQTIGWSCLAVAAGLPTLWMIWHSRFSLSFQYSPYVPGQLLNHLAILAGSVTLGLCIMMAITPAAWISIPFILKDMALGLGLSGGSALFGAGFKTLAHALGKHPLTQRLCQGIGVTFVVSAMMIAMYLALSLALPACPPLIDVALHFGHSILSGLTGMPEISLFNATVTSIIAVALIIGVVGILAGMMASKPKEHDAITKKLDESVSGPSAAVTLESFLKCSSASTEQVPKVYNFESIEKHCPPNTKGSLDRRTLFTAIRLHVECDAEARPPGTPPAASPKLSTRI